MRTYDCPQCGATVPFQSSVTVFATCGFCRSLVVRRDAAVELMGQQAELPPDMSPLRVGTRGRFQGRSFTLVGRVRLTYPEGAWTEWCADFGEGLWGWVAEAQGFYYVSHEIAVPDGFPGRDELNQTQSQDGLPRLLRSAETVGREILPPGRHFEFAGVSYAVRDVKVSTVHSGEGELTFVAVPGRTAVSADLGGPGAAFANVEVSDGGIRIFLGSVCRFEELEFADLRAVPGWTADVQPIRNATSALGCPSCGAVIELRAAGYSMAAACGNCGSVVDAANPHLGLIGEANRKQVFKPQIPLGARGRLGGTEFECIGFLRRQDQHQESWSEYLLFNPFAGFRWLVTYMGHWSLVELLPSEPGVDGNDLVSRGRPHKLFAVATTKVTYVLGEFYWRVRRGEVTTLRDFVAPPLVLSEESYPQLAERTWSAGEYQDSESIRKAFQLPELWPRPNGPYLNQPNPHLEKGRTLRWLFPVLAMLLVIIQGITIAGHRGESVLDSAFDYRPGETNLAVVTPIFELNGNRSQALEFALDAPVENQWFEVDIDLVHAESKTVREVSLGVEYYHGYDDGYWSEGSTSNELVVPAVEPGRYYLVITPTADSGVGEISYRLGVKRDVTVWSNFWLGLILLLIYPVFRWIREFTFERTRWSQSDFPPPGLGLSAEDAADADDE